MDDSALTLPGVTAAAQEPDLQPLVDQLTAAGTSQSEAATIAATVLRVTESAVLAVCGPAADSVVEVAGHVIAELQDPQAPDLIVAMPDAATWTVAEVEDKIMTPVSRQPTHRWVLVVQQAGQMTGATADRLLKKWEEPDARTLVLAAARTVDDLPVTLRSRCHAVLAAPVADPSARASRLAATYPVDQDRAEQIVRWCGDDALLAVRVAAAAADRKWDTIQSALEARHRLATGGGHGFAQAEQAFEALAALAALPSPAGTTGRAMTATAAQRIIATAALRERAASLLTRHDPGALRAARRAEVALAAVRRNVPTAACVAAALT